MDGRISASPVAGGLGDLGEKREGTELYLMVALIGVWGGRKEVPRGAVAPAAAVSGDGEVSVANSRRARA